MPIITSSNQLRNVSKQGHAQGTMVARSPDEIRSTVKDSVQLIGLDLIEGKTKTKNADINHVLYEKGTLRLKPPESKMRGMFGGPSELSTRRGKSINSVKSSRKTSDGRYFSRSSRINQTQYIDCNNDEFLLDAMVPRAVLPEDTTWGLFTEHIKNIDDDTEYHTKPRQLTFRSSNDYKRLVEELNKLQKQRTQRKVLLQAVKNESHVLATGMNVKFEQNRHIEDEEERAAREAEEREHDLLRTRARSHWHKIRTHVQEKIVKNKAKQFAGWGMITQTLRKMNDTQRTRFDLYDRYIVHKDPMYNKIQAPESYVQRVRTLSANPSNKFHVEKECTKRRVKSAVGAVHMQSQSGSHSPIRYDKRRPQTSKSTGCW